MSKNKKIIVTGSTGFIGFSLCTILLERGDDIVGIDNHNDYYDTKIKDARLQKLKKYSNYIHYCSDITNQKSLDEIFREQSNKNLQTITNDAFGNPRQNG